MRTANIITVAAVLVALFTGAAGGLAYGELLRGDPATGGGLPFASAGDDVKPCGDLFTAGRPTSDVLADLEANQVCDHNGDTLIVGTASFECPDGRRAHYPPTAEDGTRFGWGIDGDVWRDLPAGQNAPWQDCSTTRA